MGQQFFVYIPNQDEKYPIWPFHLGFPSPWGFTCHCKYLVINLSRLFFILLMLISSLGSLEHLLTYETKRQQSVVPMITAIDALKRLYSTSSTLPVLARSLGLTAISALPPIKVMLFRFCHVLLHKGTVTCRGSKGLQSRAPVVAKGSHILRTYSKGQ